MATQKIGVRQIRNLIIFGVLFAAAIYLSIRFIEAVLGIFILFSLVALIVAVLNPGVAWLQRHWLPRPVSAALIALLVLGSVGTVVWLAIPPAGQEIRDLANHVPEYMDKVQHWLSHKAPMLVPKSSPVSSAKSSTMLLDKIEPIITRIGTYTLSAVELVVSAFVVLISVVYSLASPEPIAHGVLRLFQADQRQRVEDVMGKIAIQMRRWAWSVVAGNAAILVLVWILLGPILNMPYAFLFAIAAGILEIVPTIGPVLSAIPPTLVALTISPTKALWVLVGFVIIQQIENHLIVPLILGKGVRIHPVSVLFSVMVMGGLFGIIGIFLAVPTSALLKTLVEELYIAPREANAKRNKPEGEAKS